METVRYKFLLSYDGTEFSGFQFQPDRYTIQGEIEAALMKMTKGIFVRIHGAGRTDAGVHARAQVIHFDYPQYLAVDAMQRALNTLTSDALAFFAGEIVDPSFHARFCAKGKQYVYRVDNSLVANPFTQRYTHHHPYQMDKEQVDKALSYFVGEHDFTTFSSTRAETDNRVRTIYEAKCRIDEDTNEWIFTFRGNGFLYNMIRIIMGTVLQVSDGRRPLEDIPRILEAKDRNLAGPTGSPKGLRMEEVYYTTESK
ncbi:tRNA pseudouridine(38-40) synthase TruA [Lacticigenium naphthae]|uniref:tRNA pseudouridine(38-40) synthase TruA n=1 Tax=Lacticigenium naphthae TaxID=515351 RepID=UPI0003FCE3F0|nr:tRNA pseudouridine(38-40) synthase TruA [Lacticigenium naphthae]